MAFRLKPTHRFPDINAIKTWDGEPITGLREMNGKLLIFTKSAVYELRELRWYEKFSLWLKKVFYRM